MSAKLAWGPRLDFEMAAARSISGTFWRTISDAKTVEAETRMQAEDLAKAEASVLIISISTKTRIGLSPLLGNKNLCLARNFFPGPGPSQPGPALFIPPPPGPAC